MDSELSGIETVKLIRKKDKDISVAFVTTSKDHALESYRLSAIKYIEKPYSKENIEDTLSLALLKKQDTPSLLVQKTEVYKKFLLRTLFILNSRYIKYLSV